MKLVKKSIDIFSSGLWITGGREHMPTGTIRRGQGQNAIVTPTLRSRPGHDFLFSINANSLFEFNGLVIAGDANGNLWRNGVKIASGLGAGPFTYAKMPPNTGIADYMFVGGTNNPPIKVDQFGNVTNWGIAAPTMAPSLAIATGETLTILSLSGDASNWSAVSGYPSGGGTQAISNNTTYYQAGSSSLNLTYNAPAYTVGTAGMTRSLVQDFTHYADGTSSPDEDLITIWVYTNFPQLLTAITLQFTLDSAGNNYYTYNAPIQAAAFTNDMPAAQQQLGINSVLGGNAANNIEATFVSSGEVPGLGYISDPAVMAQVLGTIHSGTIPPNANAWYQLRVAKSQFTRAGSNTALNWSNVLSMSIFMQVTNPSANAVIVGTAFSNLQMIGGAGMEGNYTYAYAYANTATQTVSNPSPFATITGVSRQGVFVSNLQPSSDPQVNAIVIYRTMGNGALLFFDQVIPIETSVTDTVQDFIGFNGTQPRTISDGQTTIGSTTFVSPVQALFTQNDVGAYITGPGIPGGTVISSVTNSTTVIMSAAATATGSSLAVSIGPSVIALGDTLIYPIQLSTSNAPPTNVGAVAGPFNGSMFWLDASNPGRVWYSGPPASAEYAYNYQDVTFRDDHLQNLVIWNNNIYLISEKGLFIGQQVSQSPLIYTFTQILGAPGTTAPNSVQPGKLFLFYQSGEGYMGFDGYAAHPFGMEAMGPVFRGESAEDLKPMNIIYSTYSKGEVYMSDGVTTTLVVDENTRRWRNYGVPHTAIYYLEDQEKNIEVINGQIVIYDVNTFTDAGTPIAIDWQTPALALSEDTVVTVRRIVIDINLNGATLTPTVIIDDGDLPNPPSDGYYFNLPTITASGRARFEFDVGLPGKFISLRLTGNASSTGIIELFHVFYMVESGDNV